MWLRGQLYLSDEHPGLKADHEHFVAARIRQLARDRERKRPEEH